MKLIKRNKQAGHLIINETEIEVLEGYGMKCKRCKRELVGKEKYLCRSCSMEFKDKGKKVLATVGSIAGIVITVAAGGKATKRK